MTKYWNIFTSCDNQTIKKLESLRKQQDFYSEGNIWHEYIIYYQMSYGLGPSWIINMLEDFEEVGKKFK